MKEIKRFRNYITWRDSQGNFNTECNRASLENDICLTIPTNNITKVALKVERERNEFMLRIRKLTPKECMRLMGFSDEDYQALVECGLSNTAIYHCAGDSIITTCLASILCPLISDNRLEHKRVVEDYVEHYIIQDKKV